MATLARAKAVCKALPGATSDIKWGADLVYSVGGKMFAVMPVGPKEPPSISFKVDDVRFLELTDREGFVPAPYLARAKWVLVRDLKKVGDAELKALIQRSHALIAARLTVKARKALGVE
jgi:predicted DNA-binding protein (MmcQ/YjbR family)